MSTLTETQIMEVQEMLDAGMLVDAIHHETGVSVPKIYKVRREMGITGRQREALEGVDVEQVASDYREGKPIRMIAEEQEISINTMYAALLAVGEPLRRYTTVMDPARKRQYDEAVAMYEGGILIRTIVFETGLSQYQLHKELHRRGLPLRHPRKLTPQRGHRTWEPIKKEEDNDDDEVQSQ
ncbi:hypothetical protein LCGC14_1592030 [marine sediment metagenome]|uniref:Resolvase HTH domain-containing protein n=1 Tax=marine sediment metagenome TaxID=412755 RepID=A0A0F9LE62_9ZZZZ